MTVIELLQEAAENIKVYRTPDIKEAVNTLDKLFWAYKGFDLIGKEVVDLWFAENKLFVLLSWSVFSKPEAELFQFPLNLIVSADPVKGLRRLRVVEQLEAVKEDIGLLAKQLEGKVAQRDTLLGQLNEYKRD